MLPLTQAPAPAAPGLATTPPVLFRAGTVLPALVVGATASGDLELQVAGRRLEVRTDLPVAPGERVSVRVLEAGRTLVLGLEPGPAAPDAAPELPLPPLAYVRALQAAFALGPVPAAALRQELAALSRPEREALAAAAVARERALLEASPELAWLRSVQAALTALGDARPAPPETPPSPGLALLLPGLPAGAPPDRLRVCGESPRGAPSRPADGRTARAVLELALPALGPTVASLALRGGALEVRIELADAAGAALVAARLPELGGTLAALGFEAATSAGPARTAALGGDGAAPAAPARAVSLCA